MRDALDGVQFTAVSHLFSQQRGSTIMPKLTFNYKVKALALCQVSGSHGSFTEVFSSISIG